MVWLFHSSGIRLHRKDWRCLISYGTILGDSFNELKWSLCYHYNNHPLWMWSNYYGLRGVYVSVISSASWKLIGEPAPSDEDVYGWMNNNRPGELPEQVAGTRTFNRNSKKLQCVMEKVNTEPSIRVGSGWCGTCRKSYFYTHSAVTPTYIVSASSSEACILVTLHNLCSNYKNVLFSTSISRNKLSCCQMKDEVSGHARILKKKSSVLF